MPYSIRPATVADYQPRCELVEESDAYHQRALPDRFRVVRPGSHGGLAISHQAVESGRGGHWRRCSIAPRQHGGLVRARVRW